MEIVTKKGKKTEIIRISAQEGSDKRSLAQALNLLKSATLYKILKDLKVPNRSKLVRKPHRVEVLQELITFEKLEKLGYLEIEEEPQIFVNIPLDGAQSPPFVFGARLEVPTMGIDVHKRTLVWHIVTPQSTEVEGVVANTKGGCEQIIQICRVNHVGAVAMESTAEYWLQVYWALSESQIPTLVANPVQTKATQGKKTDRFDAKRIALAMRDGRLLPSVVCTREQFSLRKITRELMRQVNKATAVKNRLNQIFEKTGCSDRVKKYPKTKRGKQILHAALLCETREEIFSAIQEAYSRGKGKTARLNILEEYTAEMWMFFQQLEGNFDRLRFEILFKELLDYEANILHLETEGLKYAKRHPSFLKNLALLLTIPGIDFRTGLIILAEIVDIRFFSDAKHLTRWAGLTPRVIQSGHKKRATGRLYKGGNKFLRTACWISANVDYIHGAHEGHVIGSFVARLINEKHKSWKTAVTAGARKLLSLIHTLLTKQEPFSLEKSCSEINPETLKKHQKNVQRKHRQLNRLLKVIEPKQVAPLVLSHIKRSWEHYRKNFDANAKLKQELKCLIQTG